MNLTQFERSYRSQSGEDGILNYIFNVAGTSNKELVEIGFDATSNSLFLLCQDWKGLLIDMNIEHVNDIKSLDRTGGNMRLFNAWVTVENINDILKENAWSSKPDLLSIDIDGMDYHVWKAITQLDPRIVVIEYNASFGPELSVTVPYNPRFHRMTLDPIYHGASLAALTKLAEKKGYRLIGCESRGGNAFYAKKDLPFEFTSAKEAFVEHSLRPSWAVMLPKLEKYELEKV